MADSRVARAAMANKRLLTFIFDFLGPLSMHIWRAKHFHYVFGHDLYKRIAWHDTLECTTRRVSRLKHDTL
jgi:hypothetical protein